MAIPDQVYTRENVTMVDKLVLSQGDQPQVHCSTSQLAQSTVMWIIIHCSQSWSEAFKRDACLN